MTIFFILTVLFAIVALVMIVIILAQRPQGGGLAGAFGGAGAGTDSVFGGRIGDALTWATVITFSVFLGLAILLNRVDNAGAPPAVPAAVTPIPAESGGAPLPGAGGSGVTPPGGTPSSTGGSGATPPGGSGSGAPPPGTDE